MSELRFHVGDSTGGRPSWWLYEADQTVAWAGETFDSTSNARRAALAFKAGAKTARYDVYSDTAGNWRWRALRSSDKVAASRKLYSSKATAQRSADNVRDNAGSASGL